MIPYQEFLFLTDMSFRVEFSRWELYIGPGGMLPMALYRGWRHLYPIVVIRLNNRVVYTC
jgi:hypothetical protein